MAYYHSKGASKQLKERLQKNSDIVVQIHNLRVHQRYADDEERRDLEERIQHLTKQLK